MSISGHVFIVYLEPGRGRFLLVWMMIPYKVAASFPTNFGKKLSFSCLVFYLFIVFFPLCRYSFIIQECHPVCNKLGKSMALMGFVQYSSDVTVYIKRVSKCSLTVCCCCGHWIFSFNSLCSKY